MSSTRESFFFGGSFVPLGLDRHVPMSEWEKGMRQMKELGLNAYRAFVAWNRIEKKEGIKDWTELDYSLELAEKYGLKVILNVGGLFNNIQGYRPPPWLFHHHHCQHRIEHPLENQQYPNPDLLLCSDDPLYQRLALEFITQTVERYRQHPALEAWAVWNEPHGDPCYCPHTLARFRDWLQKHYSSLDALNERWGTRFPLEFPTWDDIFPACDETPGNSVSFAQKIDWMNFNDENFRGKFNHISELIASLDPLHHRTMNIQGIHHYDPSEFLADRPGISAYIEKTPYDGRDVNLWLTMYMKSIRRGRNLDDKIRIIETDSGPRPHGQRPGCQKLAALRDWTFVANGADMILSWIYRTRISGGHCCQASMTAWDGSTTERLQTAALRGSQIRKHQQLLLKVHPLPGNIALLYDLSLWNACKAEFNGNTDYTMGAHNGSIALLKDAGFLFDCVGNQELLDGKLDRYPAIFIPCCPSLSEKVAMALRNYVAQGGTLIAEALFAAKDEYLEQPSTTTPGFGLHEVFGFECVDMMFMDPEKDRIILPDGGTIEGHTYRQVMEPHRQAKTIAQFVDGSPAVITHAFGKGKTMFIGSFTTMKYQWQAQSLRKLLLSFIQEQAGVTPFYQLSGTPENQQSLGELGVFPVGSGHSVAEGIFIMNYGKSKLSFQLRIPAKRLSSMKYRDLLSNREFVFSAEQQDAEIELNLGEQEYLVLWDNGLPVKPV